MNQTCVNDELMIPCPEGFAIMGPEELNRVFTRGSANRWGVWDRSRRVMITVLWQRYNPLLAWLADMKSLVRRNEQLTRRGYKGRDYQPGGFFSTKVCGMAAEGYRFTCRLDDAAQCVETVLFKRGRTVYSLSCVGRNGDRDANSAIFEALLNGIGMK